MEVKKTTVHAVICIALMCLIWIGYFFLNRMIITEQHRKIQLWEDDFSWVYQVDCIEENEKEIILEGFAFQLGLDSSDEMYEVVLQNLDSGEKIFSKMEYIERKDVNDYFLCEYDYSKSGFIATFKKKMLNLKEQEYEILVHIIEKKRAYRTGIFIANGEIIFAEPSEFESLDIKGTDLEKIVTDGMLRVYRSDCGMYVYQYENALYWITEPKYAFNEEKETYIQWHLDTSQIENLPQYRLENQWYFDNLGFYFSENELKEWNTGKYRVAKKELPTEYSITRMNTGRHEGEWIWKEDFRPYYEFNNNR